MKTSEVQSVKKKQNKTCERAHTCAYKHISEDLAMTVITN